MFRFSLQFLSETVLKLRRTERDIMNVYWSSRTEHVTSWMCIGRHVLNTWFWEDFNETSIFSPDFRKTLKYLILCKSVQREPSCSRRTDRQTDLTKLIVNFRNSRKAPKNHRQLPKQQSWYQSRIWNSYSLNTSRILYRCTNLIYVVKGKAVPLQALSGPVRFPRLHDSGTG